MGWGLLLIGLLFAPIVWAFTRGRNVGEVSEDHDGGSAYGNLLKHRDRPGGPVGGGGPGGASS